MLKIGFNPFIDTLDQIESYLGRIPVKGTHEFFGSFPVDIVKDGDEVKIKAEIPGMKKEELSVSLDNGILTIKADQKEDGNDLADFLFHETNYGVRQRSFSVGEAFDPSGISASYTDGILEVSMKKKPESFKKISIS